MKRIPSSFPVARRPVTPLRPTALRRDSRHRPVLTSRPASPRGGAPGLAPELGERRREPHGVAHVGDGALDLAPGPVRARNDQFRHEPLIGLEGGPALLYRREEPVERRGLLLLDLDVAYLPGPVPLGQAGDLGRAVVER